MQAAISEIVNKRLGKVLEKEVQWQEVSGGVSRKLQLHRQHQQTEGNKAGLGVLQHNCTLGIFDTAKTRDGLFLRVSHKSK